MTNDIIATLTQQARALQPGTPNAELFRLECLWRAKRCGQRYYVSKASADRADVRWRGSTSGCREPACPGTCTPELPLR